MDNYKLNISPARRHFKQRIGQVNHFMITTLVGLDGVKKGEYTLSDEFKTSWNPQDINCSVERSVRFVLDSTLSWVIDNLDSYFIETIRKPSIIESESLELGYNRAKRSVDKRFLAFYNEAKKEVGELDKYAALVALAIQWRNNIVHFAAENIIENEFEVILNANKDFYYREFRHLDIVEMLKSFKTHNVHPSFKEVASMIHGIHKFVEHVDRFLLNHLDIERFKKELIEEHCSEYKNTNKKIKKLSEKRKSVFYQTLFRQYGFEIIDEDVNDK